MGEKIMQELFEIASVLNELYQQRAVNQSALEYATEQLEHTKANMVPVEVDEGGRIVGAAWPGNNDKARDAVRDATYVRNPEVDHWQKLIRENKDALLVIEAKIAGLEADRRAIEWDIRAKQVDYTAPHADGPAEDPLDVELQADVDTAAFSDTFDSTPYDVDDILI
jgi:hypothetical protein